MDGENAKFFNELQVINDNINLYYEKPFNSTEEEYSYNYQIKNQIKILLEKTGNIIKEIIEKKI